MEDALAELLLNDEPLYLATRNEDGREIRGQVWNAIRSPSACKQVAEAFLARVDWYEIARRMDEND